MSSNQTNTPGIYTTQLGTTARLDGLIKAASVELRFEVLPDRHVDHFGTHPVRVADVIVVLSGAASMRNKETLIREIIDGIVERRSASRIRSALSSSSCRTIRAFCDQTASASR